MMYSNKENVNTLTALLVAHGIRHAVVCPGSRNAPIVHNLNECPAIACHPVTDERSAGFFALGIAQATDEPVAVCVTSGTALLNLAPAVAEAHYQHQSLVVVSADRPERWIDQLDGQTLRQTDALAPWVASVVSLPEADHWHCNRLVNEALIEATADHHPCVHINVPISEPLFLFTTPRLPEERVICRYTPAADYGCLPQALVDDLLHARRPLIVFGQLSPRRFHYEGMDQLFSRVTVLHEAPAPFTSVSPIDQVLGGEEALPPAPDFILHVGDAIVSKRLKHYLRQAADARTWRISLTGRVEDTFQNLHAIVQGDAECILQSLSTKMQKRRRLLPAAVEYRRQWLRLMAAAASAEETKKRELQADGPCTAEDAVSLFEEQLQQLRADADGRQRADFHVHYANSTSIRLANKHAKGHPVWCNRGTNGIDGSLSTAAGFAAAVSPQLVFCVTGDLSFFYDQNALWNQHLGPNLRILLLNNGRGAIFDHLPGLADSPAAATLVSGAHAATAQGACRQNHISRREAATASQLTAAMAWLCEPAVDGDARPRLLEVSIR